MHEFGQKTLEDLRPITTLVNRLTFDFTLVKDAKIRFPDLDEIKMIRAAFPALPLSLRVNKVPGCRFVILPGLYHTKPSLCADAVAILT